MNKIILDQNKARVTLANALTRAAHGLSLSEKRLVMLCASKLNPKAPPPTSRVTRITAAEYSEAFDIDIDNAYKLLRTATKSLHRRVVTFFEPAYDRKGRPIADTEVTVNWVGKSRYQRDEAWVEVSWYEDILPYLTNLDSEFSSYQLKQASALRSVYSWRLLELLSQYKGTGWAEYTVEDFGKSMEATPKQLENFNNIKRRMIEPAVTELNQKDGWAIKWEAKKAGRRVKSLRFRFEKDPQGRLDLEGNAPAEPPKAVEAKPRMTKTEFSKFAKPGESTADAVARAKALGHVLGFNPFD